MKKLFLVLFLFAGLSVQSFASIGMEKMSVVDDENESLEILVSTDLVVAIDGEKSALNEEELFECWIVTIHCSCQTYVTQYCDEGLHGTIEEWSDSICCQGCGQGCPIP